MTRWPAAAGPAERERDLAGLDLAGSFVVRPWRSLVTESHDPLVAGGYCETLWLPTVGPTAYLIGRRLLLLLAVEPPASHTATTLGALARMVGVGHREGQWSPAGRGLARLVKYRLAGIEAGELHVARRWPNLPDRQIERLPDPLQRMARAQQRR